MYWAPVTCLAVKILLFIHSSLGHAYIEYLLFAKHWTLSWTIAGKVTARVSDFMDLSSPLCKSLSHHYTGSSQQPVERSCYFHSYFTNQHSEGRNSWVLCPGSAESSLESELPTLNAALSMSHSSPSGPLMAPIASDGEHTWWSHAARTGGSWWMQEDLACLVSLYSALAKSCHHRMWTPGCQVAQLKKKNHEFLFLSKIHYFWSRGSWFKILYSIA